MPSLVPPASNGSLPASLASAVLIGLASGGLWALATIYSQLRLDWLAIPLAWLLARVSRHWPIPRGHTALALVLLASGLAIAARLGLLAATVISYALGNSLLETLEKAGAGLLLRVAWLRLDHLSALYYAAALVIAAVTARRLPK